MRLTTLDRVDGAYDELGIVHASVKEVDDKAVEEALHHLREKAEALGADAVIGVRLVQSQFQWNQRTTVMGTAVKLGGSGASQPPA